MKLNVKLLRQETNSVECALKGIEMLMHYYNKKVPYETIRKSFDLEKTGTYVPLMGKYLLEQGFDVTVVTMHPTLFTTRDRTCTQQEIINRLKQVAAETNDQNKKVIGYFLEFMRSGGTIRVDIPSEEHIRKELEGQRPVGASLTTDFFTSKNPRFNFHFNLLIGMDDDFIYTLDPQSDERGGEKKYPKQEFFYGLYASAYGDLDNACLILVKPKEEKEKKKARIKK